MENGYPDQEFSNWQEDLVKLSRYCMFKDPTGINETHCRDNNLFHCKSNAKCISKHRLLDRLYDCYHNIDEKDVNTCSLGHIHRFQCSGDNETCLSPTLVQDGVIDCQTNKDDELTLFERIRKQKPIFAELYDSYVHMNTNVTNETDETNCSNWPCSTIYTRCDSLWHCPSGQDEVEASCNRNNFCPAYTHPCLSLVMDKIVCLPLSEVNNGIVNCRGATDKPHFCRLQHPKDRTRRYRCLNSTQCVGIRELCPYTGGGFSVCMRDGENENFCSEHYQHGPFTDLCDYRYVANWSLTSKILCNLIDSYPSSSSNGIHLSTRYFALSPLQYSEYSSPTTPQVPQTSIVNFEKYENI